MLNPFLHKNKLEAGCDEAGRGCLAGPVVAAAVVLKKEPGIEGLNDSKQLSHQKRLVLKEEIEAKALSYAVSFVAPAEIDEVNILNASFLAMHRALDQLSNQPEFILVDGNRFKPYRDIPFECVIKGDGKYQSIAAASILAKTYRDLYMEQLAIDFPVFDWHKNKGYPTVTHRAAILQHGATQHHRQSFRLLHEPEQAKLF